MIQSARQNDEAVINQELPTATLTSTATPVNSEAKSEVTISQVPIKCEVTDGIVPRALCSITPTSSVKQEQDVASQQQEQEQEMTPSRSETPEDAMLEDCLQALSTLKQGNTPRMTPTDTLGTTIVPPVVLNGKKPRKKRHPRNAAVVADHPHAPSPAGGRRRSVTYDDISSTTTALKTGRKSANDLSILLGSPSVNPTGDSALLRAIASMSIGSQVNSVTSSPNIGRPRQSGGVTNIIAAAQTHALMGKPSDAQPIPSPNARQQQTPQQHISGDAMDGSVLADFSLDSHATPSTASLGKGCAPPPPNATAAVAAAAAAAAAHFFDFDDDDDMSLLTIPPRDNRKRRYEWLSPYAYVRDPDARARITRLENKLAEEMQKRVLIEGEARSKASTPLSSGLSSPRIGYGSPYLSRMVPPPATSTSGIASSLPAVSSIPSIATLSSDAAATAALLNSPPSFPVSAIAIGQRTRRIVTPDERRLELQFGATRHRRLSAAAAAAAAAAAVVVGGTQIPPSPLLASTAETSPEEGKKKKRQYRRYNKKTLGSITEGDDALQAAIRLQQRQRQQLQAHTSNHLGNGSTVTQAWTKGHVDDDDNDGDDGERDLSEVGGASEGGRQRSFSTSGICISSQVNNGVSSNDLSAGSMDGESSSLPMSLSRSLAMGVAAGYSAAEAQAAAALTSASNSAQGTSGSSTPTSSRTLVPKTPVSVSKPSATGDAMEDEMFDIDIVHNSNSSESGSSVTNDDPSSSLVNSASGRVSPV